MVTTDNSLKSKSDVVSLLREMDKEERRDLLFELYRAGHIYKEKFREMLGIDEDEYQTRVGNIVFELVEERIDDLSDAEIRKVANAIECNG